MLILHATATGADAADAIYQCVGADPESASVVASSVTGAVGSVTGAVGSVTGNVGGNVVGSTGSVTGAVGSVTGAVGSVTGAVGSVTGNVGGNVVGSVASVTAGVSLATNDSLIAQTGTAQAGAAGTITLAAGASATDSTYVGEDVVIKSGTGAGQTRTISAYVGSTKVASITRNWTTTPDNTSVYVVMAGQSPSLNPSLQVALQLGYGETVRTGTAQAGAASTITLDASASAVDNLYQGAQILITAGTGLGQAARSIASYVGSTKVATVTPAWITNPDSTSTFAVIGLPLAKIDSSQQVVAASVTAAVTVGTNNDKTGYTASTVSDKTGYSLAADQPVNVTKVGGTTQTARDLGASVLISPGTGAGQLDVTSGVIKANLAQILGTALTETAGQIAAAFKKYFDIASPTSTANVITTVTTAANLTTNNDKTGYSLAVTPPTSAQIAAAVLLTPANLLKTNASNQVEASSVQGNVTGSVGSVTGNVGGNVVGSVASVSGAVGSVTADVGITQAGADKVWSTTTRSLTDKLGFALSAAGVQAVWDALTSALTTTNSIGKRLSDFVTTLVYGTPPTVAQIDTQLTGTHGAGTWQQGNTVAPDNAGVAAIKAKTDNLPADPASNTEVDTRLATSGYTVPPGTAAIVAAILDGLLTGHTITDSVAAALRSAGSSGDPWGTALPGAYGAGTAGFVVGHNLDTNVASRGTGDATAANQTTINTNVLTRLATTGYTAPLSAAATADAVWDEATSGHQTPGTTGKALTDADSGGGGDPWPTVLPNDELYPEGTAGYLVGHRLDVPVSSRAPLGTVAVEVISAGTVGGLLQLLIGATYSAAHGTALTDQLGPTDPDLAGATVTLEVGPHGGPPFLTAPVGVSGPTSAQVLTTELTSARTGACPESRTAQWAYWADWGGTPAARVVLRGGPAFLAVAP